MFQNNLLGGNQLPYSADSLNHQPNQVNIQNPPFTPNVPCTQDFQNILPIVSGTVINQIAQTANSSNLRAFTFNQISNNNYQNQDFVNLVTLVVSVMMYSAYTQNQNYSLEQLLQFGVEKGIDYHIAMNVAQYPALQNYLDMNTQNYVRNVLNELNQLKPQLQNMMQRISGGSSFGNNRPGFSGSFNSNNVGINSSSNIGSSVFQSPMGSQNQPIQTNNPSSFGSKYGNIKAIETPQVTQPVSQPTTPVTVVTEPKEIKKETNVNVPVSKSEIKWSRTDDQPFPPIIKRSEQELFISLNENQVPTLSISKVTDETMFDYETHTTLTSFGVRPSTSRLPTKDEINKTNRELNEIVDNGVERISSESENIPPFKILSRNYMTVVSSMCDMILDHEISKESYVLSGKVDNIRLFRSFSILVSNIGYLNERDERDLDKLKTAETFEEMVVMLRSTASTMTKRPWKTIEKRLTDTVNDVLRLYLSTDFKIDSFLMDVNDLLNVLKDTSTVVYEAMIKHQANIIRHAIVTVTGSSIEEEVKQFTISGDESDIEQVSRFQFLYTTGSVTSVDIDSETLDIELFGNIGNVILPSGSKLLHNLAESIYKEKDNKNPINLDYVLLSDGNLLRITKGLVGEDYYTVSIVN